MHTHENGLVCFPGKQAVVVSHDIRVPELASRQQSVHISNWLYTSEIDLRIVPAFKYNIAGFDGQFAYVPDFILKVITGCRQYSRAIKVGISTTGTERPAGKRANNCTG